MRKITYSLMTMWLLMSCSEIKKDAQSTKDFEIKIPVENFKKIPESEYTFEVKYNEARDAYRILMKNKALSGLKIIMSVIK